MTLQSTSLYKVNNHLLYKQINDDIGRDKTRSENQSLASGMFACINTKG